MRLDVEIEVDDRLLTSVLTDEWRGNFYPLLTPGDVASHLAYNLVQDRKLTSLDGFADQPEDAARVLDISADDDVEEDTGPTDAQPPALEACLAGRGNTRKPKPKPGKRGRRRTATSSRKTP